MNTLEQLLDEMPAPVPAIPTRDKTVRLNPVAVEAAILGATGETEAVILLFRMVYPDFDSIKSVDGYPRCNEATWLRICGWMRDLSNRLNRKRDHDKQVMPGGAWMNYGFSAHDNGVKITTQITDWQVIPAEYTTE